jgi:hypothetical protein
LDYCEALAWLSDLDLSLGFFGWDGIPKALAWEGLFILGYDVCIIPVDVREIV